MPLYPPVTGGGSGLPTSVAGNTFYNAGGAAKAGSKIFSASAYGVVGVPLGTADDGTKGASNQAALNACIADALAAGPGSVVLHDWGGDAFTNGGHFLESRLTYKWTFGSRLKLANAQTNGTHVYQTHSFTTQTQTIPAAGHSQGEYEFIIEDAWIDGNKSGQTAGNWGHGLAIVGFGYSIRGYTFIENCLSAGIWREYNSTQDAPSTDSGHQRASRIESLWLANNDCTSVPAANTRLANGKGALTCGQYSGWGPGDSSIGYIEIYRTDSVSGTGYQQLGIDFTAGTFRDFATVCGQVVVWGNHNIGINLDSTWEVGYLHAEGANIVYQLNSNAQENRIHGGDIFNIQSGGTLINLIGSCAHFCQWDFGSSQLQNAGTMLAVASASAFQEGKVHMTMQLPNAVANTLTSGAAGAPTAAREFDMVVSNFGGATVTPGYCVAVPSGGTVFRYAYSKQPVQLGRLSLLTPTFSTASTALTGTATVTAAQLLGGELIGTPAAAATYTTDTGANISAAIQGEGVGESFCCWLVNTSGGANTITIAAGTGVTLRGNTAVAQGKAALLFFRNTGSNAWTLDIFVSA